MSGSHSRWMSCSSAPQSRRPAAARRAWAISYQGSRAWASADPGLAPAAPRASASPRPAAPLRASASLRPWAVRPGVPWRCCPPSGPGASVRAGSSRIAARPCPDRWLPPGMAGAPGTAGRLRGVLRGKAAGARRAVPAAGCAAAAGPVGGCPAEGCPAEGCPAGGCPAGGCPAGGCPAGGCPAAGPAAGGSSGHCRRCWSGQGGPDRRVGQAGGPAGGWSTGAGSAGRGMAGRGLAAGGLNAGGRATAAATRPTAGRTDQPSSRRCRPLGAAGPVGRCALAERARDRAPARSGQMDRRTRSKSRSRISRTPAIACQRSRGQGTTKHLLTSSVVTECNASLSTRLFPITTRIRRRMRPRRR